MRILLTGATGFVGSAVLRQLVDAGESVRVFVRPDSDRRNLEGMPVEIAVGDLLAPETVAAALEGCTGLFHVAADYRLWAPRPDEIFSVNVSATKSLMEAAAAAGVERIVYTSSVAVLANLEGGAVADEETPVSFERMIGTYKRSKYLAEQEVRRLIEAAGLPAVIVNPSMPVGPRDVKPTPTGRFILAAAAGHLPAYVDTGMNVVHVDDVARGHLLAFERGKVGERYILGGENMTMGDILTQVAAVAGGRPPRFCLPHNVVLPFAFLSECWARLTGGEPFATVDGVRIAKKKMFFSSAKAERELGYSARPPEEAFRDAVNWFRANGYLS